MKNTGRVLLRGSLARLFTNGIGMAVSFILMPVLLKGLGDRNYGIWALIGAFVGFYGLFDLGVNSAVSRFIARALGRSDEEDFGRFFATSFYLLLILGAIVFCITWLIPALMEFVPGFWRYARSFEHPYLVLVVGLAGACAIYQALIFLLPRGVRLPLRIGFVIPLAAFLLAFYIHLKGNREDREMLRLLIIILGTSVAIQLPARSFAGIIESHLRYDINSGIQALESLVRLPVIWAIFYFDRGLIALALVSALLELGAALLRVYFAHRVHPGLRFRPHLFDRQRAKAILEYGSNTLLARLADMMRFRATPFVIAIFSTVRLVTPFAIAERLNHVVGDIMMSLMSVLSPVFSMQEGQGNQAAMSRTYLFTCRISTYAAVMMGGLMMLLGGAFIQRWLGAQYSYVTPIMRILVLGTVFSSAQMPTVGFLYGTSRNRFYAVSNLVHGILTIGLVAACIGPWGLQGVAWAVAAPTIFIKFFVQPAYACKALAIPLFAFYFRHALPNFLAPVVYLVAVALIVRPLLAADFLVIGVIALAACILFVPYIYAIGFNTSQRQTLRRSILPGSSTAAA